MTKVVAFKKSKTVSFFLGCGLLASCGQGTNMMSPDASELMEVRTDHAGVKARIGSDNRVTFYTMKEGDLVIYQPQHSEDIVATKQDDGSWQLLFDGRPVGYLDGDTLMLCGSEEPSCTARFFDPDMIPAENLAPGVEPAHTFTIGFSPDHASQSAMFLDAGDSVESDAEKRQISLIRYAQNQINQGGTGTCNFNSSVGIWEILYAMKHGRRVNFSEPFAVGYSSAYGDGLTSISQKACKDPSKKSKCTRFFMLSTMANKMKRIPTNSVMPYKTYYEGSTFSEVVSEAKPVVQKLVKDGEDLMSLGFRVNADNIFWYGLWQKGHTTEQDWNRMIDWILRKKMPVHIFHNVGGYWHATILLGYDPSDETILIKDSLGNTHLKAHWYKKSWFMNQSYGATGVEFAK